VGYGIAAQSDLSPMVVRSDFHRPQNLDTLLGLLETAINGVRTARKTSSMRHALKLLLKVKGKLPERITPTIIYNSAFSRLR
jgi:hypothetical protein